MRAFELYSVGTRELVKVLCFSSDGIKVELCLKMVLLRS